MAGKRKRSEIARCEVLMSVGLPCKSALGPGWSRCPHHTVKGAEEFAEALAEGAAVPVAPSRHELLGLGRFVAEALRDGRSLSTLRCG